jgi:hypothetical protein
MAQFVICPQCGGSGYGDNLGDVTDMVHEDPDFAEEYAAGAYNTGCEECRGQRVVPACSNWNCDEAAYGKVPWRDDPAPECYEHLSADDKDSVESYYQMEAEMAAERRMGA